MTNLLYRVHIARAGFELTMLVVIGTDCIGRYKFNYHIITTPPPHFLNLGPTPKLQNTKKKDDASSMNYRIHAHVINFSYPIKIILQGFVNLYLTVFVHRDRGAVLETGTSISSSQ